MLYVNVDTAPFSLIRLSLYPYTNKLNFCLSASEDETEEEDNLTMRWSRTREPSSSTSMAKNIVTQDKDTIVCI